MTPNPKNDERVDPDLFEPLLTVLGTLSSIGSFAVAWYQVRKDKNLNRYQIDRFQFKQNLSNIEAQFETIFRALREAVSLFRSVEMRDSKFLSSTRLGFGRATYNFTPSEFQYYQNLMIGMNGAFSSLSSHTLMLTSTFHSARVSGEDSLSDNLEGIHEQLNDVLFGSENFDDALVKVDHLRARVRKFLHQLENIGNEP